MHKFKNASGKYAISNVSCRWFGYLLLHYKFGARDSLCSIDGLYNMARTIKDWRVKKTGGSTLQRLGFV
jgi:hypothetical protein